MTNSELMDALSGYCYEQPVAGMLHLDGRVESFTNDEFKELLDTRLEEYVALSDPEHRRIAQTYITSEVLVNTQFVAANMAVFGPPLWFETLAFRDHGPTMPWQPLDVRERYSTIEEARAGHDRIVAELRAQLEEAGQ